MKPKSFKFSITFFTLIYIGFAAREYKKLIEIGGVDAPLSYKGILFLSTPIVCLFIYIIGVILFNTCFKKFDEWEIALCLHIIFYIFLMLFAMSF
ncbi:MAG: hypothetical protein LBC92_01200 [Rickettsiales bacterium]|jgi:hypothetical protein|nr:hypothetical protein [Rickettsiales bacterium]